MGGQFGTENIIRAIEFGFGVGDAIRNALADDGKIKGMEYIQIGSSLWPGVAVIRHLSDIKDEWMEKDAEDRQEILDHFNEELDLPNDVLEAKIEKALGIAISIVDYVVDDLLFPEDEIPEG